MEGAPVVPTPARFSDRLNAFALDGALFSGGYFLSATAVLAARGTNASRPEFFGAWAAVWAGLFLLYHAYYSSDGRRTLGKRLFGLEIVAADGDAPGFGRALLRAACYAVSSLVFALGFLWALRGGRAWHDRIAGTRVVEAAPRGGLFRAASAAAAWLVALSLVAGWLALVVVGPGMARMKLIAQGRTGLRALGTLEEEHRINAGSYTADLSRLLAATPDGPAVARALPLALNQATIRISADGGSYEITAEALDEERTALRVAGSTAAPSAP